MGGLKEFEGTVVRECRRREGEGARGRRTVLVGGAPLAQAGGAGKQCRGFSIQLLVQDGAGVLKDKRQLGEMK